MIKKQKTALDLAIKYGYYNYPRRIGLEELSKEMNISLSTFKQHIRVAKKKVMVNVFKII